MAESNGIQQVTDQDFDKTVLEAGTSPGLRIELRALTTREAGFEAWQFCIPGALYNRNDTDHDGVEDYLGTYVQDYRDDRLPSLAVLAYLPAGGRLRIKTADQEVLKAVHDFLRFQIEDHHTDDPRHL